MTMINQKVALVFPGQGSQSVGMMNEFVSQHPGIVNRFEEASSILGYDLWALIKEGPEDKLSQTQYTQPAILVASIALWDLFQTLGAPQPSVMAGHSLGEYSALVCAGSIAFEDAVKLVALRGQYMQEAVPAGRGAMAAVLGLDDQVIVDVCNNIPGSIVSAANFNTPGQVVIAGTTEGVEQASSVLKEKGAKRIILLPMSVPSHCPLMAPAANRMIEILENVEVNAPKIPVIHNADVLFHNDPKEIRKILIKQLTSPVRWVETIKKIQAQEVQMIVECGPGKVLNGLNARIEKSLLLFNMNTCEGLSKIEGIECH